MTIGREVDPQSKFHISKQRTIAAAGMSSEGVLKSPTKIVHPQNG